MALPSIECIVCGKRFSFSEVEQVVLESELKKKNKFFGYVCGGCIKDLTDGSVVAVMEPYGKIIVKQRVGLTKESLLEMVSKHLVTKYHYSLFERWRP